MPTPSKGPRLGGGPAHERLMLAGLATQLFEHRRITTTVTKAKRLRPLAERLVTFAKRGDLAARRRVMTVVRDKGVVHELFTEIAPAMAQRHGGYTRITKIGHRKGDNAPMAVIELVLEPLSAKQSTVAEAQAATGRASRERDAASAGAAAATAQAADDAAQQTAGEARDAAAGGDAEVSVDAAAEAETAAEVADDAAPGSEAAEQASSAADAAQDAASDAVEESGTERGQA